jgi:hypothetical protein
VSGDEVDGGVYGTPTAPAVRVVLDLEEARFEIFPGPRDEGIRVEADYDQANYDLTEEYDLDDGDVPTYRLEMKSRVSLLRRLLTKGSWDEEDMETNFVRVQLPEATPMQLVLELAKSETTMDLTGLELIDLSTDLSMGEYRMEIREPSPVPMRSLLLDCRMGEFRLDGLARLRAGQIVVKGMMGEMVLDMGGPLHVDTSLLANMKMGEMRLRLPDNARWQSEGIKATLGEVNGSPRNPNRTEPGAPVLQFAASVLMGELRVGAYHADPRSELIPTRGPLAPRPAEIE